LYEKKKKKGKRKGLGSEKKKGKGGYSPLILVSEAQEKKKRKGGSRRYIDYAGPAIQGKRSGSRLTVHHGDVSRKKEKKKFLV